MESLTGLGSSLASDLVWSMSLKSPDNNFLIRKAGNTAWYRALTERSVKTQNRHYGRRSASVQEPTLPLPSSEGAQSPHSCCHWETSFRSQKGDAGWHGDTTHLLPAPCPLGVWNMGASGNPERLPVADTGRGKRQKSPRPGRHHTAASEPVLDSTTHGVLIK